MCLYIKLESHQRGARGRPLHKVATRDLTVYKILEIDGHGYLVSPHRRHPWAVGVEQKAEMDVHHGTGLHQVNAGLHAWRTRKVADNYLWDSRLLYKAVIPKGARYYTGLSGSIVANRLTVLERVL